MIALVDINGLEIIQHALQDGVVAHWLDKGIAPRQRLSVHARQELLTVLLGQYLAAMERVDPEDRWLGTISHQKMPWHPHANNGQANLSGQLDIHHCERNGDTHLALDNVIEKTVAGVVVVLQITTKTLRIEQIRIELRDNTLWIDLQTQVGGDCLRHRVEALYIRFYVEGGVLLLGNEQGPFCQTELSLGTLGQGSKATTRRRDVHV